MRDGTGATQSLVVLGGTSDLAAALARRLVQDRTTRVTLAARRTDAAEALGRELQQLEPGVEVQTLPYDALDPEAHQRVLDEAAEGGDLDVVVVAFGVLGDPFELGAAAADTTALGTINFTAGIAASQAAADALRRQGHGTVVVFSSVAGERVRSENAVYGASKAGLDAFAQALADELEGSGASVMIVRPGFVHTKMTTGRPEAPFSTTADKVAADVMAGLDRGRRIVWSPPILRFVFAGLRALPGPLWRRVAGARSEPDA